MRKKHLSKLLSQLEGFKNPKIHLEQYKTPGDVAAELLWAAASDGNIISKIIADLGTGTGVLAIGASVLGAKKIYAVEVDDEALEIARANARRFGIENIVFIKGSVDEFDKIVDTIIMNPPFGCQYEHADRPFLEKAFKLSSIVYSIHLSKEDVRRFLRSFSKEKGFSMQLISSKFFEVPAQFFFHEKKIKRVKVDLYKFYK